MFNGGQCGFFFKAGLLAATLMLTACGGGGGGSSAGDVFPGATGPVVPTAGPDSFLLFPNPQKQADGTLQVGASAYATAYYEAIDPNNDRDTLAKFKAVNNFGVVGGGSTEETVVVGDQRDLGYGRRMTARRNADGTLAFVVDNYLVGGYGAYSPFNLEAAIHQVPQWHLGTNGIEFSPGPNGGVAFVKFYTFDPVTGARLLAGNLDGRGYKAMPTVCISCHGGRGDPLTPPSISTGKPLFPLVMNSVSQHRGDVQARLHPFEPASFDFSALAGYMRADLEPKIKTINKMVLCSFPIPAATIYAEDACRRTATVNEYQGTAATHLKDGYGGNGMPNPTTPTIDTYVETSWQTAGQSPLYLNVQANACRVCHLLRGTGNQSDIDFETFPKFDSYKDRIKAHMIDRGNMPLAKLIYDKYWSTPSMYSTMASYLVSDLTGSGYAAGYADGNLKPGRPIADPGPDRVVRQGATTLSAAGSLYSTAYQWSIVSGPTAGTIPATDVTLANPTSAQPVFTATANGTYKLQLVTSQGATQSAATTVTIVVDNTLAYNPSALRFSNIKAILQATGGGTGQCTTCHQPGGDGSVIPPIWYTSYDRAATGNGSDATNDHWFYTELRGRINFTDIVASPLLRKPSGHHHNGAQRLGFNSNLAPGQAGRADYDMVLNWILNGAPE